MTDENTSDSRRTLLKSIAAGSGVIISGKSLPENWTKPVVDSVLLPAHAQTSRVEPSPGDTVGNFGAFVTDLSRVRINFCTSLEYSGGSGTTGTATVQGTIDGISFREEDLPWPPGTVEGQVLGSGGITNYTIDLGFVSGTSPNRTLSVGVELSGAITFEGTDQSPETDTCN